MSKQNHQAIGMQGALIVKQNTFSGPIPAPEILSKYEQIHPGFAERIVVMAENEQEKRLAMQKQEQDRLDLLANNESKLIDVNARNTRISLYLAFTLLFLLFLLIAFCAYQHFTSASVILSGSVLAIVSMIALSQIKTNKNRGQQ